MEGGTFALAEQDTIPLRLNHPARADARALVGAALVGSALGLVLGASYLAGGASRSAVSHARVARVAAAAAQGYSEAALQREADSMNAGALAIARRHDPLDGANNEPPGYLSSQFASRLERDSGPNDFNTDLIKANLTTPVVQQVLPAAPLRMSTVNPLAGARELDCLADAVYYEARGEGSAGQAAVAQVVLNRVRHPAYPHSVCGVVFQGSQSRTCQFSFACDGSMRRGKEAMAWRRAKSVAARALGGFVMDAVGTAVSFHTTSVAPGWSMTRVAQVGSHIFYRFGRARVMKASTTYTPAPVADSVPETQPRLILASAVVEQPRKPAMGGPAGAPKEPASAANAEAKPAATAMAEKLLAADRGKAS